MKSFDNIKTNKIFSKVPVNDIKIKFSPHNIIEKKEGDVIFQTGDAADYIFLVLNGEAKTKIPMLSGASVEKKSVNDFLGEVEFFDGGTRVSSAVALTNCSLYQLTRKEINDLISKNRTILNNLQNIEETDDAEEEAIHESPQQSPEQEETPGIETELPADIDIKKLFQESVRAIHESPSLGDIGSPEAENIEEPASGEEAIHESPQQSPTGSLEEETPWDFGGDLEEEIEKYLAEESVRAIHESPSLGNIGSPSLGNIESPIAENNEEAESIDIESPEPEENETIYESPQQSPIQSPELDILNLPEELELKIPEDLQQEFDSLFDFASFKDMAAETGKEANDTENTNQSNTDVIEEDAKEYIDWDFSDSAPPKENTELEIAPLPEPDNENVETPEAIVAEPVQEAAPIDEITIPVSEEPKQDTSLTENKTGLTVDQLHLIVHAAEEVNSNIKIDDVLASIVETACELTSADRGTLYLIDEEKHELWSKILQGIEAQEIRVKIGEGLAGSAAEINETISVPDVSQDDRFNPGFDIATGYVTKSVLCFPIKNKDAKTIGVLQLLNSKNGSFTKLDEQILEALSINAAIALENAELVEQLLRTDRLASLGKMAGFILQDIKKPIITVKHFAEHIKKKTIPADVNQALDMLIEQANSVINLVQSTLSYSEGKSILQTQIQHVNKTMDNVLLMLAEFVELQHVKLFKKYDKDVLINVDKNEFYQACYQITKNACESMPTGGAIYFETKVNDNSVEISIRDTGLGIPDSIRERIFEPFMSHGKKNGTGLGLSITEKIIKDHSGSITVESNLGEGSTFLITLPIARKL